MGRMKEFLMDIEDAIEQHGQNFEAVMSSVLKKYPQVPDKDWLKQQVTAVWNRHIFDPRKEEAAMVPSNYSDQISIDKTEFIAEHERLVDLLSTAAEFVQDSITSGGYPYQWTGALDELKSELRQESKDQSAELEKYKSKVVDIDLDDDVTEVVEGLLARGVGTVLMGLASLLPAAAQSSGDTPADSSAGEKKEWLLQKEAGPDEAVGIYKDVDGKIKAIVMIPKGKDQQIQIDKATFTADNAAKEKGFSGAGGRIGIRDAASGGYVIFFDVVQ